MNQTFEQGWAARPFKEQFPQLTKEEAEHLDKLNKYITYLRFADMLTDSQADTMRQKKMPRAVGKALDAAAKRSTQAAKQGGQQCTSARES